MARHEHTTRVLDHVDRCWECHEPIPVYTPRTIDLCCRCLSFHFPTVRIKRVTLTLEIN